MNGVQLHYISINMMIAIKHQYLELFVSIIIIIYTSVHTFDDIKMILGAHDHIEKSLSVTHETRSYIIKLLETNKMMKPNMILQNIKRDAVQKNLEVPLKKDLSNFLYTLNKKTVGKARLTIGELAKFCSEHTEIPGEDLPHEPFVLDFQIFDEDDIDSLVDFEKGDQFRFVVTTRHLLKFSINFKLVLQTDGSSYTYKYGTSTSPFP